MERIELKVGERYLPSEIADLVDQINEVEFESPLLIERFGNVGAKLTRKEDAYVVAYDGRCKLLVLAHFNPKLEEKAETFIGD